MASPSSRTSGSAPPDLPQASPPDRSHVADRPATAPVEANEPPATIGSTSTGANSFITNSSAEATAPWTINTDDSIDLAFVPNSTSANGAGGSPSMSSGAASDGSDESDVLARVMQSGSALLSASDSDLSELGGSGESGIAHTHARDGSVQSSVPPSVSVGQPDWDEYIHAARETGQRSSPSPAATATEDLQRLLGILEARDNSRSGAAELLPDPHGGSASGAASATDDFVLIGPQPHDCGEDAPQDEANDTLEAEPETHPDDLFSIHPADAHLQAQPSGAQEPQEELGGVSASTARHSLTSADLLPLVPLCEMSDLLPVDQDDRRGRPRAVRPIRYWPYIRSVASGQGRMVRPPTATSETASISNAESEQGGQPSPDCSPTRSIASSSSLASNNSPAQSNARSNSLAVGSPLSSTTRASISARAVSPSDESISMAAVARVLPRATVASAHPAVPGSISPGAGLPLPSPAMSPSPWLSPSESPLQRAQSGTADAPDIFLDSSVGDGLAPTLGKSPGAHERLSAEVHGSPPRSPTMSPTSAMFMLTDGEGGDDSPAGAGDSHDQLGQEGVDVARKTEGATCGPPPAVLETLDPSNEKMEEPFHS